LSQDAEEQRRATDVISDQRVHPESCRQGQVVATPDQPLGRSQEDHGQKLQPVAEPQVLPLVHFGLWQPGATSKEIQVDTGHSQHEPS
jgi:hypothetical protein